MPRLDCCVWQLLHHIDFSGLSFASSYHFCQLLITFLKQHVLNFPHIQKKSESLNCPLITSRLAQVFTKWQVGRRRLEAARAKELGKVFSNKPNQTTTTESSVFFLQEFQIILNLALLEKMILLFLSAYLAALCWLYFFWVNWWILKLGSVPVLSASLMDLVMPTIALHSNHCHGLHCKLINHKVSYKSQTENIMKIKVNYLVVGE